MASLKVSVISLTASVDRRRLVQSNFDRRPALDWDFFDAHSADAPSPLTVHRHDQIRCYGRELTNAEIGTFKSHVALLTNFLASDQRWLLVLEDDVWLDPFFDIDNTLTQIDALKINYLRLFAKHYKKARTVTELSSERQLIRYLSDPGGAQAYFIDREGARNFLKATPSIRVPIDDELGRFWMNSLIPYALFPFPAVEQEIPSHIRGARDVGRSRRLSMYSHPSIAAHRAAEKFRRLSFNRRVRDSV